MAAESSDRRGLRASDADREQVIGALKVAFVQGRLTNEELCERAHRVFAALTYVELADVVADIPTALAGSRSRRSPWRATTRAWWFEYAVFLPGIMAALVLPGGPGTTVSTFIIFASVSYPVFWITGGFVMAASRRTNSRRTKPSAGKQSRAESWSERAQVIGKLRAALAQGRLTEDEHDVRAAQASAARSRAELAALTADLPADLADRLPKARDAWTGVCASVAAAGVLAALLLWQPDNFAAFALALLAAGTVLLAPPITVGLMVDARHQKRSRGHLRLGPALSTGE